MLYSSFQADLSMITVQMTELKLFADVKYPVTCPLLMSAVLWVISYATQKFDDLGMTEYKTYLFASMGFQYLEHLKGASNKYKQKWLK